jgi:hypothetical protein
MISYGLVRPEKGPNFYLFDKKLGNLRNSPEKNSAGEIVPALPANRTCGTDKIR